MGCRELCGGVHTGTNTNTDAIGFQTHYVGVGASVSKGKICVGVGQCEHTIIFKYDSYYMYIYLNFVIPNQAS